MAMGNEEQGSKFITTEPLKAGDHVEQQVWDAVRSGFAKRNCLGYWRYPIFSQVGEMRKEPDILIVDQELGVVVVEIISVTIEQIVAIDGTKLLLQNSDTTEISLQQQAQHQLRALIAYCDRESALWRKVTGRALIALPLITQAQWQQQGFAQGENQLNIIFQNQLDEVGLVQSIQSSSMLVPGENLEDKDWELLLSVIGGATVFRKPTLSRISTTGKTRSSVIDGLRESLYELDLQQEQIGKQIPPGPQRIRGVAGSGKTVLLCQKAAHMHLKHPEWDIALVFFTRSLYDLIISLLDQWIRRFSCGELQYNPNTNPKLQVLHAWGAKEQPGLYSTICEYHGKRRGTTKDTHEQRPNRGLIDLSRRLLEEIAITPMFDAILIDEGQDLVAEDDLKYEDKQAFYWLAYQALRPVSAEQPDQKRLIWAYDEAQSLDTLVIPKTKEIFGEKLSHLFNKQPQYPGGIKCAEVMRRCYRTPGAILTTAHAMGMGLLRPEGMLAGITNKEDWQSIGYEVIGDFRRIGQPITIKRQPQYSPNPIPEIWGEPVLEFHTYISRQAELTALAENLMHNIVNDGLNPSREILVIVLGSTTEAMELEAYVASFLMEQNIDVYIPTALHVNDLVPQWPHRDPDKFWHDNGVTVSRITRAKGHEADMVYVVGFDHVARNEGDVNYRNQLFVALTRARGWACLSGVGNYLLYDEMRRVMSSNGSFTFNYKRPPKRYIGDDE